jgi:ABC-type nitrate/sulfonate/bicarbonate transport system substrate-binding protein
MVDKGLDLVMVSGLGNETFDFAVLAASPIKSIKDFEGKTIGNKPPPSSPRLGLDLDLAQQHIRANIVSTETTTERISMLISGRVDVVLSGPVIAAMLGNQIRLAHTVTTSKYLWNSCGWWFKPDFIKKHPEAVTKFVQGLAKARQIIIENPAEAVRVYSKYNKLKDDSYKKPFVLPQFDNPPVIYTYGLEKTYKIMKDYKMLKKDIDTSKLVDGRFAKSLTAPY